MRTAYINATICNPGEPPMEGATLVVEAGKVINVGDVPVPMGAAVVDCSGRYLLPGLVDCHTHTGVSGEGAKDDSDHNEYSEAITPHTRTLDAIHPEDLGFEDARRGGVTTLGISHGSANPIGGQVSAVKASGSVVEDMVIRAPAGVKMALGENPKRVGEKYSRAPLTRMGTAYLARKAFVEAIEYRKDWDHHRALEAAEAVKPAAERKPLREPRRDLTKEILLDVLDGSVTIRNHAHRIDDIRTAIRLSEEFGYRLVIDHATEAYRIPDEIVSRGIPVVLGPIFGSRIKRELVKRTAASAGLLMAAGATVAIMTDSPVNPEDTLRDLVIMAIREGLPQAHALETVTINPARILGVDDRVGSLEVGKDADFALHDGDPWDARTNVVGTWIDGVNVFERTGPYLPA